MATNDPELIITPEIQACLDAQRTERIAAVKAAFLEGVKKHFPKAQEVALSDDALIDLFKLGILDESREEFNSFVESLRNPPPPEPVND